MNAIFWGQRHWAACTGLAWEAWLICFWAFFEIKKNTLSVWDEGPVTRAANLGRESCYQWHKAPQGKQFLSLLTAFLFIRYFQSSLGKVFQMHQAFLGLPFVPSSHCNPKYCYSVLGLFSRHRILLVTSIHERRHNTAVRCWYSSC